MKEVITNYYCDTCKRQLHKNEDTGSVTISEIPVMGVTVKEEEVFSDVCNNCISKITSFISKLEKEK